MIRINSFAEVRASDFIEQLSIKVKKEIESKGKEYILGIDEEEFKNALISNYTLEPLVVDSGSENIDHPTISKEIRQESLNSYRKYEVDVYCFTVKYNYTGSTILFRVIPNNFEMTSQQIDVDDRAQTFSFSFKLYSKDPNEFQKIKNNCWGGALTNLNNTNKVAIDWNTALPNKINSFFQAEKRKYQEENNFFEAINVKINKETTSVFTPPIIKKVIIPQPTLDKTKKFTSEPTMDENVYNDVLKVIYDAGKGMEKKPALYQGKDEEGLRDQFLFIMETRYEGTTATGETFNRGGKTDILLKYPKDNTNLFVAECKFWHGASEFHNAISQLFDRYLTWRDSRTSLILFVKNKEFTNVLSTIKSEISKHAYYVKENGSRGESSFSYLFRLPQDKDKIVYFEIIAFHYDK